jgi:hypothetical protein
MTARRPRVCFLFIAQAHQILHSLPIAVELARGWPQFEVELVASDAGHLVYMDEIQRKLGAAPLKQRLLGPGWLRKARLKGSSTPPKAALLAANLALFAGYDAVATPERTTALIRRLGVKRPMLVYTQHGAGDRGGVFEPRLGLFDLVMAAGPKLFRRLTADGLVKPENCAVVGYPKFDAVEALTPHPKNPFAGERPVVLYNPHFDLSLSSWPAWGLKVLEHFAADERYNLIFAPHIRLFEVLGPEQHAALERFRGHPRIHIDLGGPAAVDMTYTRVADLYLGDASSQIYEFLRTPRPCLFLNAHQVAWRGDESYRHWLYGPVIERIEALGEALPEAMRTHPAYLEAQTRGFAESFDLRPGETSSHRAAEAIATRLLARAP